MISRHVFRMGEVDNLKHRPSPLRSNASKKKEEEEEVNTQKGVHFGEEVSVRNTFTN